MNREEFLEILRKRLSFLSEVEIKKHIDFYDEAISDRIDEGMNEFDAVKDLGAIADIVNLIKEEYGNKKEVENINIEKQELIKEEVEIKNNEVKQKSTNDSTLFIVLAILTFPIWISIIIAIISIFFSFIIVSITFVISGIGMLISTFTILGSPLATILLNIGISLLLVATGLLLIPLLSASFKLIKNGFTQLRKVVKENF